jgi:hypothetical protein
VLVKGRDVCQSVKRVARERRLDVTIEGIGVEGWLEGYKAEVPKCHRPPHRGLEKAESVGFLEDGTRQVVAGGWAGMLDNARAVGGIKDGAIENLGMAIRVVNRGGRPREAQ